MENEGTHPVAGRLVEWFVLGQESQLFKLILGGDSRNGKLEARSFPESAVNVGFFICVRYAIIARFMV